MPDKKELKVIEIGNKAPKQDSKEIAVNQPMAFSAENLIAQAIANNTPVETMERLLAMRRELKAEHAKEEFDRAMAKFQGECPVIVKTTPGGETNAGKIAYYYAPLDVIVAQTKELIRDNGFSYAIQTETLGDKVKVTCVVKHEAGHSESSSVEVPLGTKTAVMSAPQVVAAALTFAKRYAFNNSFGILTGDKDIDGQTNKISGDKPQPPREPEKPEPASIAQITKIKSLAGGRLVEIEKKYGSIMKMSKPFASKIIGELIKKTSEKSTVTANDDEVDQAWLNEHIPDDES